MVGRDLQSRDQGLHLASTMTESSVESFLKGVRSQVEISKVKEEEGAEKEKEKEGVEEDIQGVAEEANGMVVPEEDMVTLKKGSIGDVATVKDIDQGAGDANQGGLGGEGEGEQE